MELTIKELVIILGKCEKTIYNKLNGKTQFSLEELEIIREKIIYKLQKRVTYDEVITMLRKLSLNIKERTKNEKNEHESN